MPADSNRLRVQKDNSTEGSANFKLFIRIHCRQR